MRHLFGIGLCGYCAHGALEGNTTKTEKRKIRQEVKQLSDESLGHKSWTQDRVHLAVNHPPKVDSVS